MKKNSTLLLILLVITFLEPVLAQQNTNGSDCPNVVDPVIGKNGVTYLNSCFAEIAGVTEYVTGVGFGDCINPSKINLNEVCSYEYDPVCGCNGVSYFNPCLAENNGVTTYSKGLCKTEDVCYDPQYLITNSGITVNYQTGIISQQCTEEYDPVCGCDGITYPNPCFAETSGITSYTRGTCSDGCIDPEKIDPDAICSQEYDPVCGCNNVTYANACEAEKAGVLSFSSGVCGGNLSPWCQKAVPIQCGDFLASETNEFSGNNIISYPNCINGATFMAPEKVYIINKTIAGDLQIGLEILTPNIDLDLFLLMDDCNQIKCLKSSTTDNSKTNNEGIVIPDAPIGTYYIVVDGQFPEAVGEYRLEVSCGYLYCANAQLIECGVPFQYNNQNGRDDVSLYGCGNVYNVENNGPEVVHQFSVAERGPVTIQLYNLQANLELFLLDECNRGDCMDYSQNPGTNSESINAFLEPGTYYIVVEGFNGATSSYSLLVDCSISAICDLAIDEVETTKTACGANTGSFKLTSVGGTPGFLVHWTGPHSGSFSTFSNTCTVFNLPAGVYTVTKTDVNGCSASREIVIESEGDLKLTAIPEAVNCGELGSIGIVISDGQAPFRFSITGPISKNFYTNHTFFNINDLPEGKYDIFLVDDNGCSTTKEVVIERETAAFYFTAEANNARCEQLGSIPIKTNFGEIPFQVKLEGPVSGSVTVNSYAFEIIHLPSGVYTITIEEKNGCSFAQEVTIEDEDITIATLPTGGLCGNMGSILVSMTNGVPDYKISWEGPENGEVTTSNQSYLIKELPSGTYKVTVMDDTWCSSFQIVQVENSDAALSVNVIPVEETCTKLGAIWVDIENGSPPYTLKWDGPTSGSLTSDQNGVDIPDLPAGSYTVEVMDQNGCSSIHPVEVLSSGLLDVAFEVVNESCGSNGEFIITVKNGTPGYTVIWTGTQNGQMVSDQNEFKITGLTEGSYQVVITDANNCSITNNLKVEQDDGVVISTLPVNGICGNPGSVTINISGGFPSYTVIWSGPTSGSKTEISNTTSIDGLLNGLYQITVKDALDCIASETIEILNSNEGISVDAQPISGICGEMGIINVLTSSTSSGPFTVSWDGPVSGSKEVQTNVTTITDLPSGLYNIMVEETSGCFGQTDAIITNIAGLQNVSVEVLKPSCGGGSLGSVEISVEGGTPDFEISWDGPSSGFITTGSDKHTIRNLRRGYYTFTVEDASNCIYTETIFVVTAFNAQVVNFSNDCEIAGKFAVRITEGIGPFNISWTGPQPGSMTTDLAYVEIEDLPEGTYRVNVEDSFGCTHDGVGRIRLEEPFNATFDMQNEVCGNSGSITVNIEAGRPSYTVRWSGPISGQRTIADNSYVIPNLPVGEYDVSVEDANGCEEESVLKIESQDYPFSIQSTSSKNSYCGKNGEIAFAISDGFPPFSIVWSGAQNGSLSTSNRSFSINGLNSGLYDLEVFDVNGCQITSKFEILDDGNPLSLSSTVSNDECGDNGTIEITVNGGVSNYIVNWRGPDSGSRTFNENKFSITGLSSGNYIIEIEDGNDCRITDQFIINNDLGITNIDLVALPGGCDPFGILDVTIDGGTAPYEIRWTGPQNGTESITTTTYKLQHLVSGTYTVFVKDSKGCENSEVLSFENDLTFSIVGGNLVCEELGYASIWIEGGSAPFILEWSGALSGKDTITDNHIIIEDLVAGNYKFSLMDANGCDAFNSISLIQEENLEITTNVQAEICDLSGAINVVVDGGNPEYTLTWTGPQIGSATFNSSGYTIRNLTPGTYNVAVKDALGCTDQETVEVRKIDSELSIQTAVVVNDCGQFNNIWLDILDGLGPFIVEWSGPENGSLTTADFGLELEHLDPGDYVVSVKDKYGCTVSNLVSITDDGPTLIEVIGKNGLCGENGSIDIKVLDGKPGYQISWEGPKSGSITTNNEQYVLNDLPSGTYTISFADSKWCTDQAIVVIENQSMNFDIALAAVVNNCGQYNNIWIDILEGTGPFKLEWSGPENGQAELSDSGYEIEHLDEGNYHVMVTDVFGCTVSKTISVVETDIDLIDVSSVNGVCGEGGKLQIVVHSNHPPFQISWTGASIGSLNTSETTIEIENLNIGNYQVKVVDSNWCTDYASTQIQDNASELDINAAIVVNDCGQYNNIWLDIIDGTGPFTILWFGPETDSIVTNETGLEIEHLQPGDYLVIVRDENGCEVKSNVTIVETDVELFELTKVDSKCGLDGEIVVDILDGLAPYELKWSGPENGSLTTYDSHITIRDLPSGNYQFTLADANWCSDEQTAAIETIPFDLDYSAAVIVNDCGIYNTIWIDINDGDGPYSIEWIGPESNFVNTSELGYEIEDLPEGNYRIIIRDVNGCGLEETISIQNTTDNSLFELSAVNGVGNELGKIEVTILSENPDYRIQWSGPNGNGSITTDSRNYTIEDLLSGPYTVTLNDGKGCEDEQTITIGNEICNLSAIITPIDGTCDSPSAIWVDISGGDPPYQIKWAGQSSGEMETENEGIDIKDLESGQYLVEITDSKGCQIIREVIVNTSLEAPNAAFTVTTNGLTVTVENQSDEGIYYWEFGDEYQSSNTETSYNFCGEGSYEICLTVVNNCGQDKVCQTVALTIPSNSVVLDIGEASGSNGSTVYVPVYIDNLNNLVSLAGSLEVIDTSVATLLGLSPGVIVPRFNDENQTFNYYEATGNGISLSDGAILFYLVIELNGEPGEMSLLRITEEPLSVEIGTLQNGEVTTADYYLVKGKVTVEALGQINGTIETFLGDAVPGTKLELSQQAIMVQEEFADDNGDYMMPDLLFGDTFMVKPSLDIMPENGLSTYALYVGQQYILGMDPPQIKSPYQIIAGDANCNGAFTTLDLFLIQQVIIRNLDAFPDCPSWVFVSDKQELPEDFNNYNVFPYDNYEIVKVEGEYVSNFIGVKVGDILGRANPDFIKQNGIEVRELREEFPISYEIIPLPDQQFEVKFSSRAFQSITSFQFALSFDEQLMELIQLEPSPENELANITLGERFLGRGILNFSWFNTKGQGTSISKEDRIFSLKFKSNMKLETLDNLIQIEPKSMNPTITNLEGEARRIVINKRDRSILENLQPDNILYQNIPNPFKEQTIIQFSLKGEMDAAILIHDSYGSLVYETNGSYEKGMNQVKIEKGTLAKGVYFYTLQTNEFRATKSFIVID